MANFVFAYVCNEFTRIIRFTKHKSTYNAEKHYGDLSRHYRGNAQSDLELTTFNSKEEFEKALSKDYIICYKTNTLTLKARL